MFTVKGRIVMLLDSCLYIYIIIQVGITINNLENVFLMYYVIIKSVNVLLRRAFLYENDLT